MTTHDDQMGKYSEPYREPSTGPQFSDKDVITALVALLHKTQDALYTTETELQAAKAALAGEAQK